MPTINKLNVVKEKPVKYRHTRQSAKYYNSVEWQRLRNYYIKHHPFCELCESEEGRVRLAEEVHHRIEFLKGKTEEERMNLLLDEDNLMSLCKEHHHKIHNERRSKKTIRGH